MEIVFEFWLYALATHFHWPSIFSRSNTSVKSMEPPQPSAGPNRIYIMVELPDAAALELAVQEAKQAGILRKQLLRILAIALGNALRKLCCSLNYCIVVFNLTSHSYFLL